MNITKNLDKVIDIISGICIVSILMILSNGSLIIYGIIPVILSIIALDYGIKDFLMILLGTLSIGLMITNFISLALVSIPLVVISILFIFLTKSKISDKRQIIISFIIISILFISFYVYDMLKDGLNINQLALDLKENLELNLDYNIPIEIYKISFSMFASILATMSLVYSIFSLKVIRNYLSFKGKTKDMKDLNTIRINRKDFLYIIIIGALIYVITLVMKIPNEYIIANLIFLFLVIFVLNGLSLYDYMIMKSKSTIGRVLQRFFIMVFIYFFAIVFAIFGLLDVFIDLRKKVRRPSVRV